MGPLEQSVTLFGRPGPAGDALLKLAVTNTQAGRFPRPDGPAEQRFVFDHRRRRCFKGRP
jgi:hypothetical protein